MNLINKLAKYLKVNKFRTIINNSNINKMLDNNFIIKSKYNN